MNGPHYRFNFSKNGRHVFCTGDTCTDKDAAAALFALFADKFPPSEGWQVQCVYWQAIGHPISEMSYYTL